jgi:diacylglycerol O-acyltransferase
MAVDMLHGIPHTRQLTAWGGPPRGAVRHDWAVAELETLRGIARRNGATVNDVYLAAVAGALRAWSLPEWCSGRRPLHATMPVNLRTQRERDLMSNFALGVRIALPCAEPDPFRRLARVAAETRRVKMDGSLAAVHRRILETAPATTPPRVLADIAAAGTRAKSVALLASNAGTLPGPFSVAGREVSQLMGLPPMFRGRQHLSVGLFGLGTQLCAGFTASASVPRHAELPGLWLAELAALGGPDSSSLALAGSRRRAP